MKRAILIAAAIALGGCSLLEPPAPSGICTAQGFAIETSGETRRRVSRHCGLQLIAEAWEAEEREGGC